MHENIPALIEALQAKADELSATLKVEERQKELTELEAQMGSEGFWDNPDKANEIVAHAKGVKGRIQPVLDFRQEVEDLATLWEMACEMEDQESMEEADALIDPLNEKVERLEVQALLNGPYDDRACYLAIQSGAGGTEADDWCEMLFRMYLYYCEQMGWEVEEMSKTHGTEAGLKEVTLHIKGPLAYGYLSAERGTHRLARVSPFNAEGKRQTSFATVDVTPEFPDEGGVEIDEQYLETTCFARSSGPGGQNVNKVASAVRLVYNHPDIPETIMVVCSVYRDQAQNKRKATAILKGKVELFEEERRQAEQDAATGGAVSRGWGSQIRSYVFYDNRVKDHRTSHEQPNPQKVLDGDLHRFVEAELRRRANAAS